MTGLEKDILARRRIVSEIDENFFVEAGAGSGKTTMLVNRMVAMVEAGLDISRICAITFTKAASGEFFDRFQKRLIERSAPAPAGGGAAGPGMLPEPTAETRKRCAAALRNIDLCFMGTIDSFCFMLLSEHPSEARIPSDSSIVSDEDAEAVCRQQYVRICGGECGEELRSLAKTFEALHRKAPEVFVRGLSFLMNNRNVHFNRSEDAPADIDRDFAGERSELIRAAEYLAEHDELRYDKEAKSRAAWEKIGEVRKILSGRWSGGFSSVVYALKALADIRLIPEAMDRCAVSLGSVFAPGGKQGKWLECTVGRPGGLLEKLQKLRYDASMSFLIKSVPVVEDALREKGSLTFFDCLYTLRNTLKRDAEGDGTLIRYIYDRHSYFLIDEFQDTNPLQAEVFFYLCAEHPVPLWSACVPRPGSLFIVGDPKQSIYRFRSADVASFLRVRRLFEENGGSVLSLTRNFRSVRELCAYYNRVFTALLPEETENQSRFEEIPLPGPAEGEFRGVYTYKAYTGKAEALYPDMTDPVRIADIIEGLAGNENCLIRGEGEKEPRPVRYSDIMVITAEKKKLRPIMAELDARNIPVKTEGDVPFSENRALREISLIYASVADTDDAAALYGALTGSLIALTKEDIRQFRACGGSVSLKAVFDGASCGNEAALRTAAQLERLKGLAGKAAGLSPAALYTEILDGYRIYRTLPADNLEVVCYALELMRNAERSGTVVSLKDGAAYLRGLLAERSGEERCLSLTADRDCVHMANLHKVKGLEAPVVILAAAGSGSFSGSYRIIHGDAGTEGYLFSLEGDRDENGRSAVFFSTTDYAEEKAAEAEALKAEGQRLVYVAATRARNALILCGGVRIFREKEIADSRWSPIMAEGLQDIFAVIGEGGKKPEDPAAAVPAEDLYDRAERESVLNDRSSETATFRAETPSHLQVLSKLSESPEAGVGEERPVPAGGAEDGNGAPSDGRRFAALLGTMTHRLMEMLVTTRNTANAEAAVGEIIREYRTPETAGREEELTRTLLKTAQRIRNGGYAQTNGLPQDILGTLLEADEVFCEIPFCYRDEADGNTVWNGVMDVVFSEGGRWHIVDYKTNADGSDLDVRYQAQMSAYVKAFRAITGFDADARTYHIDIGDGTAGE